METLKLIGNIKTSDFPTRITESITEITDLNSFNTRLESGGILILENAILYIGAVNPNQDTYFSLGIAKLKLVNSKIYTNGNTFEIFCKEVESDAASFITSFANLNTKNGVHGTEQIRNATDGRDGDNGGVVRINLSDKIIGTLTIPLNGQIGGNGGNGYNGKNGVDGSPGRNARNGDFGTCRRGPGRGGNGTNGQSGGNAGNGGQGGSGGTLFINYIEKDPQSNTSVNFEAKAGAAGKAGTLGKGGKAGKGGIGGSNAGNCRPSSNRERNRGQSGKAGRDGLKGVNGVSGQNGKSVIQRVNLSKMEFATEII